MCSIQVPWSEGGNVANVMINPILGTVPKITLRGTVCTKLHANAAAQGTAMQLGVCAIHQIPVQR